MQRFLPFGFLVFALVLLPLGCAILPSASPVTPPAHSELYLLATTSIVADVVRNVAGDRATIETLLPLGSDPHAFELSPRDLVKLNEADLIFLNGASLEASLEPFLEQVDDPRKQISLSEGISLIGAQEQESDHEDEHVGDFDPHVWMDPRNVLVWVENILSALVERDPANAVIYQANAQTYRQQLMELDAWIQDQVARVPPQSRLLVSDHMAFGYFARRYGFQQVGAIIPSVSSLAEPSAQELAALEDAILAQKVKAIFLGVGFNAALAERLAQDTGVQVVLIYTGSLSDVSGPAATYLDYMRYNVLAIVSALE